MVWLQNGGPACDSSILPCYSPRSSVQPSPGGRACRRRPCREGAASPAIQPLLTPTPATALAATDIFTNVWTRSPALLRPGGGQPAPHPQPGSALTDHLPRAHAGCLLRFRPDATASQHAWNAPVYSSHMHFTPPHCPPFLSS